MVLSLSLSLWCWVKEIQAELGLLLSGQYKVGEVSNRHQNCLWIIGNTIIAIEYPQVCPKLECQAMDHLFRNLVCCVLSLVCSAILSVNSCIILSFIGGWIVSLLNIVCCSICIVRLPLGIVDWSWCYAFKRDRQRLKSRVHLREYQHALRLFWCAVADRLRLTLIS